MPFESVRSVTSVDESFDKLRLTALSSLSLPLSALHSNSTFSSGTLPLMSLEKWRSGARGVVLLIVVVIDALRFQPRP